jgi:hypothetical protein
MAIFQREEAPRTMPAGPHSGITVFSPSDHVAGTAPGSKPVVLDVLQAVAFVVVVLDVALVAQRTLVLDERVAVVLPVDVRLHETDVRD